MDADSSMMDVTTSFEESFVSTESNLDVHFLKEQMWELEKCDKSILLLNAEENARRSKVDAQLENYILQSRFLASNGQQNIAEENEAEELHEQIESLSDLIQSKDNEIAQLKRESNNGSVADKVSLSGSEEIRRLKDELSSKVQEIRELRLKKSSITHDNKDVKKYLSEIDGLNTKLESAKGEIGILKQRIAAKDGKTSGKESTHNTVSKAEFSEAQDEINSLKEQLQKSQKEAKTLQTKLTKTESKLDKAEAKLEKQKETAIDDEQPVSFNTPATVKPKQKAKTKISEFSMTPFLDKKGGTIPVLSPMTKPALNRTNIAPPAKENTLLNSSTKRKTPAKSPPKSAKKDVPKKKRRILGVASNKVSNDLFDDIDSAIDAKGLDGQISPAKQRLRGNAAIRNGFKLG